MSSEEWGENRYVLYLPLDEIMWCTEVFINLTGITFTLGKPKENLAALTASEGLAKCFQAITCTRLWGTNQSPDYYLWKFPLSTSEIISFVYLAQSPLPVWCNNVLACHYFKKQKTHPRRGRAFLMLLCLSLGCTDAIWFKLGGILKKGLLSGESHVKFSFGTAHSLIKPASFVWILDRKHACSLRWVQLEILT